MSGGNENGQLGVGDELGPILFFFPHFLKNDFFIQHKLKVIDVALGSMHTLVLCYDAEKKHNRLFGMGSSKFGCLGYGGSLTQHVPLEVTDKIPGEVK